MLGNGTKGFGDRSAATILLIYCSAQVTYGCAETGDLPPPLCSYGTAIQAGTGECGPVCGDGKVILPEECDDANEEGGDGCSAQCTLEAQVCNTRVEPTQCPALCNNELDCGYGKCMNTPSGPTCVCDDYIGPKCDKRCLLTAGWNFTVASDYAGTVVAWGNNDYGQLGNSSVLENRPSPGPVAGLPTLGETHKVNASPVSRHTLAIDNKGEVWSWGDNTYEQLGIPVKTDKDQVVAYAPPEFEDGHVSSISAGRQHSLAIYYTNIFAWGDSATLPETLPIDKVAACDGFNLALDNQGRVYSWGTSNLFGQQGTSDPLGNPELKEVVLPNPHVAVAIACGEAHSLVLSSEGRVRAWGSNKHKQLGDAVGGNSFTPASITFMDDAEESDDNIEIVAIAAGARHSVALDADGHVWTWGDNTAGQLGYGSTEPQNPATPRRVQRSDSTKLLDKIISIDAGGYSTLALDESGVLWVWGDNTSGQLGIGNFDTVLSPRSSLYECWEEPTE